MGMSGFLVLRSEAQTITDLDEGGQGWEMLVREMLDTGCLMLD
jgi:hypothetical protein